MHHTPNISPTRLALYCHPSRIVKANTKGRELCLFKEVQASTKHTRMGYLDNSSTALLHNLAVKQEDLTDPRKQPDKTVGKNSIQVRKEGLASLCKPQRFFEAQHFYSLLLPTNCKHRVWQAARATTRR